MALHDLKFSAADTVRATGVSMGTLQNWLKPGRGIIVGADREIEGGGSQGKHRLFSFHAVMQIATARALMEAGMENAPKKAAEAAAHFAHVSGGGAATWDGERSEAPERFPGVPFHPRHGDTIFVVGKHAATLVAGANGPTYSQMKDEALSDSFVVIDASRVFDQVCENLGLDARRELDKIYPNEV